MNIEQFIEELLANKSSEMEEFTIYVSDYKIEDKSSYTEWKSVYISWVSQKEDSIENIGKIPKILLSDD